MRRRLTVGGVIAAALGAVIAYLAGGFPGLGTGGSGLRMNSSSNQSIQRPPEEKPVSQPEETPTPDSLDRDAVLQNGVLHVLIEGRQYAVKQAADGTAEYRSVELNQLVDLAKKAPGDEDGIRVRISRRESARATAERRLEDELIEAGLSPESIVWESELLPAR